MNENDEISRARQVLREWLLGRGDAEIAAKVDSWDGAAGPAACSFLPGGGRSNRIYLVKDDRVLAFSPSEMDITEALTRLNEQREA